MNNTTAIFLTGLGSIVALLTYLETREHRKLQLELLKIDKEAKLKALKNGTK